MTTQDGFAWRFDWGLDGLGALAPVVDVIVIVDVLRFTTAVTAAVERGVSVTPAPFPLDGGPGRAWELSPRWIREHPARSRLVLASPNGAALMLAAVDLCSAAVLAGCLANASAVARAVRQLGATSVAVIAAGERTGSDHNGPPRAAVEDLLGAGAVLAALDPAASISAPGCSPEAAAARAAFVAARPRLPESLRACVSGRDLAARGLADDVADAAQFDVSTSVPVLRDGELTAL